MNKEIPLFIDSGAHGLYNEYVIKKNHTNGYCDYDEPAFYEYVDTYAAFIKAYKLEVYANVDAIFNPKKTWEVQQYLEKVHGLSPMPVIHYGTPLKWLKRYLNKGYDYIALGGLGQEATKNDYVEWADAAFTLICDQPSRLPICKVHGFAMTSHTLMIRYPWYSVDSTSWLKYGSYGMIIVPPYQKGEWRYDISFFSVKVSQNPSATKMNRLGNNHLTSLLNSYIRYKGFSLGKSSFKKVKEGSYTLKENERFIEADTVEIIEERGLCNDDKLRTEINALYFVDLANNMTPWPWSFETNKIKTLW